MGRKKIIAPKDLIFVSAGRGPRYRQVNTQSPFFLDCDYFIINEDEQKITFERAPLDATGNIKKGVKYHGDWIKFQFTSEVPIGTYKFDPEESDEDRIVVYYSEQLA